MENKYQKVCGSTPSILDGSESILKIDHMNIPDTFSWQPVMPVVTNQGSTSTCVCHSLISILDFLINSKEHTPTKSHGFAVNDLYKIRKDKNADGMQIKEALKYLRHDGLKGKKIPNYSIIKDVETLKRAVVMYGPCVAGVKCYDTVGDDFWNNKGAFMGGHAIVVVGITPKGFVIRNSWGTGYAKRGYVEIPYNEFKNAMYEAWVITL